MLACDSATPVSDKLIRREGLALARFLDLTAATACQALILLFSAVAARPPFKSLHPQPQQKRRPPALTDSPPPSLRRTRQPVSLPAHGPPLVQCYLPVH